MLLQSISDLRQEPRTYQVPVGIVDLLEMVEVNENDGELITIAP